MNSGGQQNGHIKTNRGSSHKLEQSRRPSLTNVAIPDNQMQIHKKVLGRRDYRLRKVNDEFNQGVCQLQIIMDGQDLSESEKEPLSSTWQRQSALGPSRLESESPVSPWRGGPRLVSQFVGQPLVNVQEQSVSREGQYKQIEMVNRELLQTLQIQTQTQTMDEGIQTISPLHHTKPIMKQSVYTQKHKRQAVHRQQRLSIRDQSEMSMRTQDRNLLAIAEVDTSSGNSSRQRGHSPIVPGSVNTVNKTESQNKTQDSIGSHVPNARRVIFKPQVSKTRVALMPKVVQNNKKDRTVVLQKKETGVYSIGKVTDRSPSQLTEYADLETQVFKVERVLRQQQQPLRKQVSLVTPDASTLIPEVAQPLVRLRNQLGRVLDPKFSDNSLSRRPSLTDVTSYIPTTKQQQAIDLTHEISQLRAINFMDQRLQTTDANSTSMPDSPIRPTHQYVETPFQLEGTESDNFQPTLNTNSPHVKKSHIPKVLQNLLRPILQQSYIEQYQMMMQQVQLPLMASHSAGDSKGVSPSRVSSSQEANENDIDRELALQTAGPTQVSQNSQEDHLKQLHEIQIMGIQAQQQNQNTDIMTPNSTNYQRVGSIGGYSPAVSPPPFIHSDEHRIPIQANFTRNKNTQNQAPLMTITSNLMPNDTDTQSELADITPLLHNQDMSTLVTHFEVRRFTQNLQSVSQRNTDVLLQNQDHVATVTSPEVRRKNFSILNNSPSSKQFWLEQCRSPLSTKLLADITLSLPQPTTTQAQQSFVSPKHKNARYGGSVNRNKASSVFLKSQISQGDDHTASGVFMTLVNSSSLQNNQRSRLTIKNKQPLKQHSQATLDLLTQQNFQLAHNYSQSLYQYNTDATSQPYLGSQSLPTSAGQQSRQPTTDESVIPPSAMSDHKLGNLTKERIVMVLKAGSKINAKSEIYQFDLNKWLYKYYVYSQGGSTMKNKSSPQQDIQVQARFYQHAVSELLQEVNDHFKPAVKTSKLPSINSSRAISPGKDQVQSSLNDYTTLYTLEGVQLKSIVEIETKVRYLVACKRDFFGVKLDPALMELEKETNQSFARKMLESCKIELDTSTAPRMPHTSRKKSKTSRNQHSSSLLSSSSKAVKPSHDLSLLQSMQALITEIEDDEDEQMSVDNIAMQMQGVSLPSIKKQQQSSFMAQIYEKPTFGARHLSLPSQLSQQDRGSQILHKSPSRLSEFKQREHQLHEAEKVKLAEIRKQRKVWRNDYQVNDKQMFNLFSEFAALVMIAKQAQIESDPDSMQSKFQTKAEAKDYLGDVLPFSGNIKFYQIEKKIQQSKMTKLSVEELKDFRIPVSIFKNNCSAIHKSRAQVKNRILQAIGIDTEVKDQKVDWESFMLINKLLNPKCQDRQQQESFAVKLFDPILGGIVKDHEFEAIIRELFASEAELLMIQNGQGIPDELKDENSVSESMLRDLLAEGVYEKGGYLKPDKLREAIAQGTVDLDVLIQAIK